MNRLLLIISIILFSQLTTFSQNVVKGYIIDELGSPIKFAHIQDENNSRLNTSANEEGVFEMNLPSGQYELKVSAQSFTSEIYELDVQSDTSNVLFILIHTTSSYEEIVIYNDEDPGVIKMREVIKKRKQHAEYLQSLISDVYLKGNLKIVDMPSSIFNIQINDDDIKEMGLDSNKQGIMYLLEQHTKYYYKNPNQVYHEIQSVRTSGDAQGLGFSQIPPIINVYENNIHILEGLSPRGIVSPAHSNAFYYYNYKLVESFYDGDKLVSKIKVTPKRKHEPLFTGYVYVVENDWIFHSVELSIDRSTGIDLLDTLTLTQTYNNYEQDKWIIKNQVLGIKLKMLGISLAGDFLTHYTHQSINEKIDSDIFNSKIISVYDSLALNRDSTYWEDNRKIPLTDLEANNFVKGDSLLIKMKIQDSIFQSTTYYHYDPVSILATGFKIRKHPQQFKTNGLIDIIQFNNVEGLNLTLKPEYTNTFNDIMKFRIGSHIRYGFASEKLYATAHTSIQKTLNNNNDNYFKLHLEGGEYIDDITQLKPISETYNTYLALSGRNFLRFYDKKYMKGYWEHALGNGFQYRITVNYEDRNPLENNTDFTWFGTSNDKIIQNNPDELPEFKSHTALSMKLQMEYQPGWRYIQYPKELKVVKNNTPIFRFEYEKGFRDVLGSDVDYDKLSVGMRASAQMRLLGRLDVNAEAGGFLNKSVVGNPDLFHNNGNQIWIASPYLNSFQNANYYELSHSRNYAKAHAEWHLNGFLSNKVPLIKKLNWHFVIANNTLFFNTKDYYTETSFGLENIGYNLYRFGRIDFIYGYNSQFKTPTYGIKVGFSGLLSGVDFNLE